MSIADKGCSTLNSLCDKLDYFKPKFEKEKIILEYIFENDKDKLLNYCITVLSEMFEERSYYSSNFEGKTMLISQNFTLDGNKYNFISLIQLKGDNNFNLIYYDGPITKMIEISKLLVDEIYSFTLYEMNNYVENLESQIKSRREYLQEKERKEYLDWFYDHY